MRFTTIILAGLLLVGLLGNASAAGTGWFWGITYEPSIPIGDLDDFSQDSFSWRGVGVEGRSWFREELSVGFAVSWNVFHSRLDDRTFSQPGVDLHGTQMRDVNAVPIYINMHYYLGRPYDWRFFLGLNAGTIFAEHRLDMGLYSYREENWHLAIAPEVGVQLPYDRLLGYVSVRWNNGFSAGEIDEVSYFSFRLGIGLR
jgi:hypothetical protein